MKLLAILAALGLEQWWAADLRRWPRRAYRAYLRWLEVCLAGWGTWAATVAALLPTLLVVVIDAVVAPVWLLMLLWSALLLYVLMGFRHFSHAVTEITENLQAGDLPAARRTLYDWQGGDAQSLSSDEIARRTIESGAIAAYRGVFGVVFWFVLLGPAGAAFYWMLATVAREWAENIAGEDVTPLTANRAELGRAARWLIFVFDWLPVRFLAFSFAVVGNFEDAIYRWRAQPDDYAAFDNASNEHLLLATAAGALGLAWEHRQPVVPPAAADKAVAGDGGDFESSEASSGGEEPGEEAPGEEAPGEILFSAPLGEPPEGMAVTPAALPSAIGLVWRALLFWLVLVLLMTLAYWV